MARQINPLGFRLGTTQNHYSIWFAQPKHYPEGIKEDLKIRNYIQKFVKKRRGFGCDGMIGRIEIKKNLDLIEVILYMVAPIYLTKRHPDWFEDLHKNLQKELNCVKRNLGLNMQIKKIEEPYGTPNILAEFVAEQIMRRVSVRKAMKKAIGLSQQAGREGIKIKISGRIDGRDIARSIWLQKGRVPLQTIRAKMDYYAYIFRTIHGVMSIKIWQFIHEELY
uniref:Small ribosomal subunit protein uS3c n=1 Tax=Hypertelis spergulacea TaxID=764270 RepID=A0A411L8T2_9CARY|nr:ribosomal protein S3 [Hypertelis spergulacea]